MLYFNSSNSINPNIAPYHVTNKNAANTNNPVNFDSYLKDACSSSKSKQLAAAAATDTNIVEKAEAEGKEAIIPSRDDVFCEPPIPMTASAREAWIEAMKKLTPHERFVAKVPFFSAKILGKQYSSYSELIQDAIENAKDNLLKVGRNDKTIKEHDDFIKIMETVLDSFAKHGVAFEVIDSKTFIKKPY